LGTLDQNGDGVGITGREATESKPPLFIHAEVQRVLALRRRIKRLDTRP
jgi:hypothetical protein